MFHGINFLLKVIFRMALFLVYGDNGTHLFQNGYLFFSHHLSKTLLSVNIAFFETALPHWDMGFSVGSFRDMKIELDKCNEGK